MRPIGGASTRWAERLGRAHDEGELTLDAALAHTSLAVEDGVDPAPALDAGGDAVATVGGRGRAAARAVELFRALAEARDELPPADREFGAFTEALVAARAQVTGDLAAVLDHYIALRRQVAIGVGSIASG